MTAEQLRLGELAGRVYYAGPEPHMVPATLADFECAHGLIGDCLSCELELEQRRAGADSAPRARRRTP